MLNTPPQGFQTQALEIKEDYGPRNFPLSLDKDSQRIFHEEIDLTA